MPDLKCFVENILNLKGGWNWPGGIVKLFCSTGWKFILKWYGFESQKRVIQANRHIYCKILINKPENNLADNTAENSEILQSLA